MSGSLKELEEFAVEPVYGQIYAAVFTCAIQKTAAALNQSSCIDESPDVRKTQPLFRFSVGQPTPSILRFAINGEPDGRLPEEELHRVFSPEIFCPLQVSPADNTESDWADCVVWLRTDARGRLPNC